jgi:hypothetical protein
MITSKKCKKNFHRLCQSTSADLIAQGYAEDFVKNASCDCKCHETTKENI